MNPTSLSSYATGGSWHPTYAYTYQSTSGDYAIFDLTGPGIAPGQGRSIKVGITSGHSDYNTWLDDNPSTAQAPFVVTDNGTTVDVGNGLYVFTKPTTASWISSGGGTSTEEVSVNYIRVRSNSIPWIDIGIAADEPTGSYPVTAGGSLVQGSLATNPIYHTNGTPTESSLPIAYGGYGVWHLHQNYVSSALNTPIATVTVVDPNSLRKKVHCNFW